MVFKSALWLVAAAVGLPLAAVQNAPRTAPVPRDSLEIVTSQARAVEAPAKRADVLRLLDRGRESYSLRNAGRAYDLKVTFTVNSYGQTEYDGVWEMEDVFDPRLGHRWTAKNGTSYAITRISTNDGMLYGEETASYVPLRLHEARAAFFDAIPASQNAARGSIRRADGTVNGARLNCVLLSGSRNALTAAAGRRLEESEDCFDQRSGLLQLHSQVPGRYYTYDYANGPRLGSHVLPRKVTVTEAGKIVTEISVESLTEIPAADPSLFVPTEEMKARGRAITLAGAQKIFRVLGPGPLAPGAPIQSVCVFGVVTPSGQLAEAHSLQPSDPNSQAAVQAAKRMTFPDTTPLGPQPQQHFVFVFEQFASSQQRGP
jgi:hypothetical protein